MTHYHRCPGILANNISSHRWSCTAAGCVNEDVYCGVVQLKANVCVIPVVRHSSAPAFVGGQVKPTANAETPTWQIVIADMRQRDEGGAKKYGTRLQPNNGRDSLWDAYEETLDTAVYLRNAIIETRAMRGELSKLRFEKQVFDVEIGKRDRRIDELEREVIFLRMPRAQQEQPRIDAVPPVEAVPVSPAPDSKRPEITPVPADLPVGLTTDHAFVECAHLPGACLTPERCHKYKRELGGYCLLTVAAHVAAPVAAHVAAPVAAHVDDIPF